MSKEVKTGTVSFHGDKPMQIVENAIGETTELTKDQIHTIDRLSEVIREYRDAAKSLLSEKYSHLKSFAPDYLADPGNIMVACCTDGIVVRYEKKLKSSKILTGWMPEGLSKVASMLSQNLIQCHTSRQFTSTVEETGMEINIFIVNPSTSENINLTSTRIGFDVVIDQPDKLPSPPQKPFRLASVRNAFTIDIKGVLLPEGEQNSEGKPFLARSKLRLPVGWECIEIYPVTDLKYWKPEYASAWAEIDILAAVATEQFRESHYQSLDPNAEARKQYGVLLRDFKSLLDARPEREEILQVFLKTHPFLLCPTNTKMWPKLTLGSKDTDFVFRDATLDYLLVELEKSTHQLFRKDGHPRNELNVAIGQITDWKRYIGDNLRTVQHELGLTDISNSPQSIVVIGRSHTLTSENRSKLTAMNNEHPKLKIMTYDDVYHTAKAVIENLLGPIWDQVGETQIYYPTQA